jgi:hypothetical protein
MSYHGKLQTLKNGTADVEIQQWAYQQLEKAKILTDEEIQEIAHGFEAIGWMGETTYEFARAILRKAQNG